MESYRAVLSEIVRDAWAMVAQLYSMDDRKAAVFVEEEVKGLIEHRLATTYPGQPMLFQPDGLWLPEVGRAFVADVALSFPQSRPMGVIALAAVEQGKAVCAVAHRLDDMRVFVAVEGHGTMASMPNGEYKLSDGSPHMSRRWVSNNQGNNPEYPPRVAVQCDTNVSPAIKEMMDTVPDALKRVGCMMVPTQGVRGDLMVALGAAEAVVSIYKDPHSSSVVPYNLVIKEAGGKDVRLEGTEGTSVHISFNNVEVLKSVLAMDVPY